MRDRTEDMKIFRSTFVPSDGTSIAFPETNVYEIIYRVPKLRGERKYICVSIGFFIFTNIGPILHHIINFGPI